MVNILGLFCSAAGRDVQRSDL